MSSPKKWAEWSSCEHGSSTCRDRKLFKTLFFALAAQAPLAWVLCLTKDSNRSIYRGKHSSQYAFGSDCYSQPQIMPCLFSSGVLQHFTTGCAARRSSDAGKGCTDSTQQISACGSLCQPWWGISLCPQTGCCHRRGAGRESAYSGRNDLAVSANSCPLLKSSCETAKWPRPHSMSLLDRMPGTRGPHRLGALLQFQLRRTNASFQASVFSATCFLKDPTDAWPCLAWEHLLQQIQTEL